MNFIGGPVSKGLVEFPRVVKAKVAANANSGFLDVLVVAQVHVLIFYRSPQTLDKNIVECPPSAVHTESDALVEYSSHKFLRGELDSLVGVENLWPTIGLDRFLERLQVESCLQACRKDIPSSSLALFMFNTFLSTCLITRSRLASPTLIIHSKVAPLLYLLE